MAMKSTTRALCSFKSPPTCCSTRWSSLSGSPSTASPSKASAGNDGPPVSNSLMAAIKCSQVNQCHHPESFHAFQHGARVTTSFFKVEMVEKGRGGSVLGSEIRGICLEKEIGEFLTKGGSGK
ncbi:hypothetical protein Fmac_008596 [Flemingia macrophylla]|uniref:Uncharacterized protein n=1 Tax=Flemingia macrophylla TaxID=520843 RepID=A0ABD1MXV5_9FABA